MVPRREGVVLFLKYHVRRRAIEQQDRDRRFLISALLHHRAERLEFRRRIQLVGGRPARLLERARHFFGASQEHQVRNVGGPRPLRRRSKRLPAHQPQQLLLRLNRLHIQRHLDAAPFQRLGQLDGHLHARRINNVGIGLLHHRLLHGVEQVTEARVFLDNLIDTLVQSSGPCFGRDDPGDASVGVDGFARVVDAHQLRRDHRLARTGRNLVEREAQNGLLIGLSHRLDFSDVPGHLRARRQRDPLACDHRRDHHGLERLTDLRCRSTDLGDQADWHLRSRRNGSGRHYARCGQQNARESHIQHPTSRTGLHDAAGP